MPRIRVYADSNKDGDNDPKDFCAKCWDEALDTYEDDPCAEITEDDHPDYSETNYRCEICGKKLTDKDD